MNAVFRAAIIPLVFAPALPGCGGSGPTLYAVSGKLTKGGEPLAGVTVSFLPTDTSQPGSAGVVGSDGSFTMICQNGRTGAVAGLHKVVLAAPITATEGASMEDRYSKTEAPKMGAPRPQDPSLKQELPFPREYASPDTTPRQFEVIPGDDNTIEIAIE